MRDEAALSLLTKASYWVSQTIRYGIEAATNHQDDNAARKWQGDTFDRLALSLELFALAQTEVPGERADALLQELEFSREQIRRKRYRYLDPLEERADRRDLRKRWRDSASRPRPWRRRGFSRWTRQRR